MVLAVPGDGKVSLWDVKSGKHLRDLRWPEEGSPWALAFSPDGRALAGASFGEAIHIVDSNTGAVLGELKGPAAGSLLAFSLDRTFLAFSPDGRTLSVGNGVGVVELWEVATVQRRAVLEGHRGPVFSVAFSADGKCLATGSADTTALVWDLAGRPRWQGKAPAAAELAELWNDLAKDDAARAYRAIQQLALAPEAAVPFLAARLRPVAVADAKGAAKLLGEALRELRALEALEATGTPAAQKALARLARGHPGARLTREARASLERLSKRARAAE
jgi:hypothetical protein